MLLGDVDAIRRGSGTIVKVYRGETQVWPSGGGTFSPADLPGLRAWYKADAITGLADGDPVATWPDSGPNGYDLTQATAAKRPVWRATGGPGGKPAVRGDGVDDVLRTATVALWTGGITVFIVAKGGAATPASDYWLATTDGNNQAIIAGWEASGMVEYYDLPRTNVGTSDAVTFAVYEFYDLGTGAAGSAAGLKNGTVTETAAGSSRLRGDRMSAFAAGLETDFADVDIAEVIVYQEGKSDADRSSVRNYLASKYGITVS